MNKNKIIIGLVIALILILGFIGYVYYSNYQQLLYNTGWNDGMNNAGLTILANIQANGYININYGNQTITLVPYQGVENE